MHMGVKRNCVQGYYVKNCFFVCNRDPEDFYFVNNDVTIFDFLLHYKYYHIKNVGMQKIFFVL